MTRSLGLTLIDRHASNPGRRESSAEVLRPGFFGQSQVVLVDNASFRLGE